MTCNDKLTYTYSVYIYNLHGTFDSVDIVASPIPVDVVAGDKVEFSGGGTVFHILGFQHSIPNLTQL